MPVVIDGSTGVTTPGVTNSGTDSAAIQTYGGVAMPRMVLSTAQNTTSGTSIDFTGIPSWVKRLTLMLNGVSTNGTSNMLVQIGDSGGIETTGYVGSNSSGSSAATLSAGFTLAITTAAALFTSGHVVLTNVSGNIWVASGMTAVDNGSVVQLVAGNKTLSPGPLDRIRITTAGGTDTFDAGSVNIMYEG
jgi:hypothetical protein